MMSITKTELLEELKRTGALLTGHFILTSGKHSAQYLQCAKILQYPDLASRIGQAIANSFADAEVDVVAAPAIGGIVIGHEVARALGARSVFSEREDGVMTFRRGLDIQEGERVLAVEDVITTGGSVRETITAVEKRGGVVVGVSSILDRSGGEVQFGYPFKPLLTMKIAAYDPNELPEDLKALPAVKPGSRKI
jgi:orotate phosphoribosyltransferase